MTRLDRVVGGLSCSQVLEQLSDYVDGELEPAARTRVEAHLKGCEQCTRFGGEFAASISALRARLLADQPDTREAEERLRRAIERELQSG